MKCILFFILLLIGSISFGQENPPLVLDTSCIHPILNSMGYKNIYEADGRFLNPGMTDETMGDDSFRLFFEVDTISQDEFGKLKSKFKSGLNRDTSLVEWTDTSFVIPTYQSGKYCRADKRDNSEFEYYIGYLEPLQLFAVSSIAASQEIGVLKIIDKVSGKIFYLDSPSDYPLESLDLSPDTGMLSAFVNDHYNHKSFISLFKISKKAENYTSDDFRGFYVSDCLIKDFIWVSDQEFSLSTDKMDEDGRVAGSICIRVRIL